MMLNSTQVSYFILTAYFDTGHLKYLFFLIILVLYICILSANLLLIVVICVNRSLHEPMYMFLCSLFVNELYGSTGLFPFLLLQILSDVHTVSAPLCFLQIFCIYSYVTVEFSTLVVMSYDRYLAICYPLQYHTYMTFMKVAGLITATWLYSFVAVVTSTLLSSSLQLCGTVIDEVICGNHSIVKLACSDTTVSNVYELSVAFFSIFFSVFIVLYSYMRILKVCFSGCKESRQKAASTCTPHLVSLLSFFFAVCFQLIQSRFDLSSVNSLLQIFLSLFLLACQPLINPVMYGLKMSQIRIMCKNLFSSKWILPTDNIT